MTAPQDRAGLVRVMARSVLRIGDREWPIETFPGAILDAEKMLAAIEAAGCRVVTVEVLKALQKIATSDFNCTSRQLGRATQECADDALAAASPFAPPQGDKP